MLPTIVGWIVQWKLSTAVLLTVIEAVVAHFGDRPVPVRTLAEWLAGRPELAVLNAHVRQKELAQA